MWKPPIFHEADVFDDAGNSLADDAGLDATGANAGLVAQPSRAAVAQTTATSRKRNCPRPLYSLKMFGLHPGERRREIMN